MMRYRDMSPEQRREYHRLASRKHRAQLGKVCRRCSRPCDELTKTTARVWTSTTRRFEQGEEMTWTAARPTKPGKVLPLLQKPESMMSPLQKTPATRGYQPSHMIKGGYQPPSSTNEKISPTSFPGWW